MKISKSLKYYFLTTAFAISILSSCLFVQTAHADSVNQQWMQQFAPANTSASGEVKISKDNSGNIFIGGDVHDNSGNVSVSLVKYDSSGNKIWDSSFGSSGINNYLAGQATSSGGNTYILVGLDSSNVRIVKFDSNGNQLWNSGFGEFVRQSDSNRELQIDTQGNVYIVGGTSNNGIVTAKFDSNGNQVWSSTSGSSMGRGVAISVDNSNNVIVSGTIFNGPAYFGQVVSYDNNGNQLWLSNYNSGSNDQFSNLTLDSSGNAYATGMTESQSSQGNPQAYLTVKIDGNGNQQWASIYGYSGFYSSANAIKVDSSGNVYVTGTGSNNGFVMATVKYDSSGNQTWADRYSYNAQQQGTSLELDGSGNVYVGGSGYTNSASYDYVLVKYDGSGNRKWVSSLDNGAVDIFRGMSFVNSENIYATGYSCDSSSQNCKLTTAKYSESDSTPPIVTGTPDSQPNANGWYDHNVTINWSATDPESSATTPAPTTASTEGTNITYTSGQSCNPYNYCATGSISLSIDKTTPTIIKAITPAPNNNNWNNGDTTVSYTCSDALSGILNCSSPISLVNEGAGQTVTGSATDKAGNNSSVSATINIDKTAPTVGVPTWTSNPLQQGQTTTLRVPASDSLSGIASVQYSIDGGISQSMSFEAPTGNWATSLGSTLAANTYNISITATDFAGNTSTPVNDILAVYNPANGYVTGHAKTLPTAGDTLPIVRDTSNNPAKLIIGFTNVTSPTSGSFDIDYKIKKNKDEFSLSSTNINYAVVQDSTHASILGHANLTKYVNSVQTVVNNVSVKFDITLGTGGNPDHITVRIFNPGVDPNTGTPAYTISDDVIANGSNLMIHP